MTIDMWQLIFDMVARSSNIRGNLFFFFMFDAIKIFYDLRVNKKNRLNLISILNSLIKYLFPLQKMAKISDVTIFGSKKSVSRQEQNETHQTMSWICPNLRSNWELVKVRLEALIILIRIKLQFNGSFTPYISVATVIRLLEL